MAIVSKFARDERAQDIPGCPLANPGDDDESACASCRFNVLAPGTERLGCVLATPHAGYEKALGRLLQRAPADHATLTSILDRQRRLAEQDGLGQADLTALRAIAERWERVLANDEVERQMVTAMLRFSEAGLGTGELVRILA